MREIKFRCFNKTKGTYVNSFVIKQDGTVVSHDDLEDFPVFHSNEFILEQYTGIKDINGNEIYEGDFVIYTYKNHVAEIKFGYYDNELIDDNDSGLGWYIKDLTFNHNITFSILSHDHYDFEIIGNINENPELLENK